MRYSLQQYAQGLRELMQETPTAKRREVIQNFLFLIAKNNAFSLLPEIEREYETIKAREHGTREVLIRAPERVSDANLARKLPFKAHIDARRDARLRGGMVLEVEDMRVDNSIAKRLRRLREALTK